MQAQEKQDVLDLFGLLESHQPQYVNDIKSLVHENFNSTKDSWLLNGLYDYYLVTNSSRCVDVLVGVREPHDKYLLDRLADGMRGSQRLQSLTLLSHLVRKQPTWLFKLSTHSVTKEFFKILKSETDILPVMCTLLTLITLLPMIPSLLATHLQDMFEVFSRLAAWNTNNPNRLPEEHLLHLQVGLYVLFHRLYGLFPCNFLSYLRQYYGNRVHQPVFLHTIKPMLHTVKMHPLLVTASKEVEVSASRWKKMEHHDVLVESSQCSLDTIESSLEDFYLGSHTFSSALWSRRSVDFSAAVMPSVTPRQSLEGIQMVAETTDGGKLWSPSFVCDVIEDSSAMHVPLTEVSSGSKGPEKTSPPEAAVEATPETTPLSTPVTAWESRSGQSSNPAASVPSSPLCREALFPESPQDPSASFLWERRDSLFSQRLQKVVAERQQPSAPEEGGGARKGGRAKRAGPHLSPLKIPSAQDLEEIEKKLSMGTKEATPGGRLEDEPLSAVPEPTVFLANMEDLLGDECLQEPSEPCPTASSSPPPPSDALSFLDFARRVRRLRFYSQCVPEGGGSEASAAIPAASQDRQGDESPPVLRRAASWPEMPRLEQAEVGPAAGKLREAEPAATSGAVPPVAVQHSWTQTEDPASPLPYEHLFPAAMPLFGTAKEDAASSPAGGFKVDQMPQTPHQLLNHCMALAASLQAKDTHHLIEGECGSGGSTTSVLRKQLLLLYYQLLFERHRRQVHAERNRRLASKFNSTRALEEHNTALKDQLGLLEQDMKVLREEVCILQRKRQQEEKQWQSSMASLEEQLVSSRRHSEQLAASRREVELEAASKQAQLQASQKEVTSLKAVQFHLENEVRQLQEKVVQGQVLQAQLERTRKELLLMGELQQKYREQLSRLQLSRQTSQEIQMIRHACREEVNMHRQQVESKISQLEAFRTRVSELEVLVTQKDTVIGEQKRLLKSAKEEAHEEIQAVERKYKSLKCVNQQLESRLLELQCQVASSHSCAGVTVPSGVLCVFGSPQLTASLGEDVVEGLAASQSPPDMQNLELLVGRDEASEEVVDTSQSTATEEPR